MDPRDLENPKTENVAKHIQTSVSKVKRKS